MSLRPRVTRYTFDCFPPGDPWHDRWRGLGMYTVTVEDRDGTVERGGQRPDTDATWAVMRDGYCHDGTDWDFEPSPSSRDEAFYARFRFKLFDAFAIGKAAAEQLRAEKIDEWGPALITR